MKEQLEVTDLKGNKIGVMNVSRIVDCDMTDINSDNMLMCNLSDLLTYFQVEVAPCNAKGKEYTEADDKFVDAPDELVGKEVNFVFKIVNCRGIPNKYTVRKHDCSNEQISYM